MLISEFRIIQIEVEVNAEYKVLCSINFVSNNYILCGSATDGVVRQFVHFWVALGQTFHRHQTRAFTQPDRKHRRIMIRSTTSNFMANETSLLFSPAEPGLSRIEWNFKNTADTIKASSTSVICTLRQYSISLSNT